MTQNEAEKYKDATWSFIMEHCDILPSGKIFVKFHIDGRKNFENRVWARYRYDYHREDWKAKETAQKLARAIFTDSKKRNREAYLANKRKRSEKYAKQARTLEWLNWYERTQEGGILSRLMGYVASITWNRKP